MVGGRLLGGRLVIRQLVGGMMVVHGRWSVSLGKGAATADS